MDEPEEPVGALRFMGRSRFYAGEAMRELATKTKLAHHGEVAFLDYLDEADQHWTLIIDGRAYRAAVSPFLVGDNDVQVQRVGDFNWKPDQILLTLHGWLRDWKQWVDPGEPFE